MPNSSSSAWFTKDTEPAAFHHIVRIEGAGAADPVKLVGRTVTVTRLAAVGKYRVQWGEGPGTFVAAGKPSFQATTPSDVKGYSAVVGDYDVDNKRIDVWVFDAAGNLDDLEATWKLALDFTFKTSKG